MKLYLLSPHVLSQSLKTSPLNSPFKHLHISIYIYICAILNHSSGNNDAVLSRGEGPVLPARSTSPRWGSRGRRRTAHLRSGHSRPWCARRVWWRSQQDGDFVQVFPRRLLLPISLSFSLSLSVPLSSPSGAVDAIKRTATVCARMLPLPRSRGRRLQKTKVGCVGVHPTAFRCQGQRWLPTKAMKNTLNNKAEKRLDAWSVVVSCFSFGHGEQNKKTAFCFYVFFFKQKFLSQLMKPGALWKQWHENGKHAGRKNTLGKFEELENF